MNLNTEVKKLFNASNFSLRIKLVITESKPKPQTNPFKPTGYYIMFNVQKLSI